VGGTYTGVGEIEIVGCGLLITFSTPSFSVPGQFALEERFYGRCGHLCCFAAF